jgi:hypothetical protein
MDTEPSTSDLYSACHVLFGSGVDVSADFLRYLQMPGLKAVYRKRALETHPDRSATLSRPAVDMEKHFKEVNAAYQDLHTFLENPSQFKLVDDGFRKESNPPSGKMRQRHRTNKKYADPASDRYRRQIFRGNVPNRELLFGQYLYYFGSISYKQLINSIIWQKSQRPLVGRIAMRLGWLHEDEISEILKQRRRGEKFGEIALRRGYLSSYELRIVLARQRLLQPRIGKYFIERKILTSSFIEKLAEASRLHNRPFKTR